MTKKLLISTQLIYLPLNPIISSYLKLLLSFLLHSFNSFFFNFFILLLHLRPSSFSFFTFFLLHSFSFFFSSIHFHSRSQKTERTALRINHRPRSRTNFPFVFKKEQSAKGQPAESTHVAGLVCENFFSKYVI